jgi:hypothetical protein
MQRRLRKIPRYLVSRLRRQSAPYIPTEYWEKRAVELVETYDAPETWPTRGWLRAGIEEAVVPPVLKGAAVRTVIVVWAGSGRQYGFLEPYGFDLCGFDISPTLVATCRRRYPTIRTELHGLIGARAVIDPADAVLSTAVLQHVPPTEIKGAIAELEFLARRLIVLREAVFLRSGSDYLWAHDYPRLLSEWKLKDRTLTDETTDFRTELLVFEPAVTVNDGAILTL